MTDFSVSDFTLIINEQLKAHTTLTEHLMHLRQVMEFTLSSDLSSFKPAELHAQLVSIAALMEETEKQNEALGSSREAQSLLKSKERR